MHDPFLPPPPFLRRAAEPLAAVLGLPTLPLHIHELLLAFALYTLTQLYVAPWLSNRLFPRTYPTLNKKTKLNWDVRMVSLLQSSLINVLALWVMWSDEERRGMDWRERVWGYTGGGGMVQGFAAGYFAWDLCVCLVHIKVFGWGLLAHAMSALAVFGLGFRPFVNFYGSTFILYELSSPFLNFHWFFDKLGRTGSTAQLYNGLFLTITFFSCRLVWGTYQSIRVYQDVWAALQNPGSVDLERELHATGRGDFTTGGAGLGKRPGDVEGVMQFAGPRIVPVWLAVVYLGSNIVLNSLNFYWFGKMLEAFRKRFRPTDRERAEAAGEKKRRVEKETGAEGNGELGFEGMTEELKGADGAVVTKSEDRVKKETDGEGKTTVEVERREVRRRGRRG